MTPVSTGEADTIAAVASPPGQGAVSLIRVSGKEALDVVTSAFRSRKPLTPRTAVLGKIVAANGDVIDEVLATAFAEPASYTGEDTVEIACHGGILVTRSVLARIVEAGARPADAGEFSRRAFQNGKMDLTQAEAVMDLISAQTERGLRAAHEQLSGRLGQEILELREALLGSLAHLEAYIDFPEEDIDPETGSALAGGIANTRKRVADLLATADQGRILREGVRTVLCGAPNAGKSSLLNRLLGHDRAIVSSTAGTTRDTIEETVNLRGYPLRLTDTAGVRDETDDAVEAQGIQRTRDAITGADLVLEIVDSSQPVSERIAESSSAILVKNKSDLGVHSSWTTHKGVEVSCTSGEGFEQLAEEIEQSLTGDSIGWGGGAAAINTRHQACLKRAATSLDATLVALEAGTPPEFVALDLREALTAIGEVIGTVDTEELLGQIFGTFCIGK